MKAFPSYVQAYSKHQAAFIFRITELDIPSIAYSWGLLKLPRMPELKTCEIKWDEPPIDVSPRLERSDLVERLCLYQSTERSCPPACIRE